MERGCIAHTVGVEDASQAKMLHRFSEALHRRKVMSCIESAPPFPHFCTLASFSGSSFFFVLKAVDGLKIDLHTFAPQVHITHPMALHVHLISPSEGDTKRSRCKASIGRKMVPNIEVKRVELLLSCLSTKVNLECKYTEFFLYLY